MTKLSLKLLKNWAIDVLPTSEGFTESQLSKLPDVLWAQGHKTSERLLKEFNLSSSLQNTLIQEIGLIINSRLLEVIANPSPGEMTKLVKHSKTLHKFVAQIEDILSIGAVAITYNLSASQEINLPNVKDLLRALNALKTVTHEQSKNIRPINSLKKSYRQHNIAGRIAKLYKFIFKKSATVTRHQITGEVTGKFVDFARIVEFETNPYDEAAVSPQTVASALKDQKRAR